MKIFYLVHIIEDAAVRRRISMFHSGGAEVKLAGFRRDRQPLDNVEGIKPVHLGRARDANMLHRAFLVLLNILRIPFILKASGGFDIIVARNLETIAIAAVMKRFFRRRTPLVYECLDIHRKMLSTRRSGRIMRAIERFILSQTDLLIVSSPAFISGYFEKHFDRLPPVYLLENKVLWLDDSRPLPAITRQPNDNEAWTIGWFGIIRCRKSLDILDRFTRAMQGKIRVVIRGKPALHEFADFHGQVNANPWISFEGPYKNPEDLERIYSEVHFVWAIDYFEEGLNSLWLLPNRLYEGGFYGAVPIALASVETGKWLKRNGLGVLLDDAIEPALISWFQEMPIGPEWHRLSRGIDKADRTLWMCTRAECIDLVKSIDHLRTTGTRKV